MNDIWTLHLQIRSPLREMIRAEAKDTGETFAAIVRRRVWESYQADIKKNEERYEQITDNGRYR